MMYDKDIAVRERAIAEELGVSPAHVCLVGSRLICAGEGNDWDFLVLCAPSAVERRGYAADLEGTQYPSLFGSYRKDKVNLIVTEDRGFFLAEYAIACSAQAARDWSASSWRDMSTREARVEWHGRIRGKVLARIDAATVDDFA